MENFPYPRQFSLWELKCWASSDPQLPCPSTLGLASLPKLASCMLLPSPVLTQEGEAEIWRHLRFPVPSTVPVELVADKDVVSISQ
ncbi:hypothetical protein CapIbe_023598 [Capra ibex]